MSETVFKNCIKRLIIIYLDLVHDLGGSFSAEHGIGLIKKRNLKNILLRKSLL